jgi:hypothetical protein
MNSRAAWIFVTLAVLATVTVVVVRRRPSANAAARPQGSAPAKGASAAAAKTEIVPIQDGKTIDFSTGFPVIKDSEKEKAIIARVAKEMEDAARGVTFESPRTAPPDAGKK